MGGEMLLKIYLGESARHHGEPLYHTIVKRAKESGMSGATALRGIEGFGAGSTIHSTRIVRLSENLPIVIEIADTEEKILAFLDTLKEILPKGTRITLQKIEIVT